MFFFLFQIVEILILKYNRKNIELYKKTIGYKNTAKNDGMFSATASANVSIDFIWNDFWSFIRIHFAFVETS